MEPDRQRPSASFMAFTNEIIFGISNSTSSPRQITRVSQCYPGNSYEHELWRKISVMNHDQCRAALRSSSLNPVERELYEDRLSAIQRKRHGR